MHSREFHFIRNVVDNVHLYLHEVCMCALARTCVRACVRACARVRVCVCVCTDFV